MASQPGSHRPREGPSKSDESEEGAPRATWPDRPSLIKAAGQATLSTPLCPRSALSLTKIKNKFSNKVKAFFFVDQK